MQKIPAISLEKMRQLDRLMVEEYGISTVQMMETAGRSIAELGRRILGGNPNGRKIFSACGAGNNGGDALAAARYLKNWGAEVEIILAEKQKLHALPKKQLKILEKMGSKAKAIQEIDQAKFDTADLIIDGVIGYNLEGDPRGGAKRLIQLINQSQKPVLAVDLPSGLDADSGRIGEPCIKAQFTLALSLPKQGAVKKESLHST